MQDVHTEYYSWRNKGYDSKQGAQIDLVIERDDRIINICEIKYCSSTEYELTIEERNKMTQRIECFRQETATRYGIIPTLITTYGLRKKQAFRLLPRSSHHDDRFDVTLRTWAIINALNKAGLKPQAQSKRICNADERG